MRFSRSGSNESRVAPATASTASTSAAMRISLLRRRQRRASASRIRSVNWVLAISFASRGKPGDDNMRGRTSQAAFVLLLLALSCQKAEPLTAAKAEQILRDVRFTAEPIYAEVPQKVWWNARFPKDEFDERSLHTFDNLQKAGLITVTGGPTPDGASYIAHTTSKGFPILGTDPSARGPVFRGLICYRVYDGLRNSHRPPPNPPTAHGELLGHYPRPTSLYPMFETKQNKPLNKPFV